MGRRGAPLLLLVLLALLLPLTGCGDPVGTASSVEVRVVARSGGVATEDEIRKAAAVVDLALGELGIADRTVTPQADGRLRISLPASESRRMPDVLARLRDGRLGVEPPEE